MHITLPYFGQVYQNTTFILFRINCLLNKQILIKHLSVKELNEAFPVSSKRAIKCSNLFTLSRPTSIDLLRFHAQLNFRYKLIDQSNHQSRS